MENIFSKNRIFIITFFSLIFSLLIFFSSYDYFISFLVLLFLFLLVLFFLKPLWGLYLMAVSLPINGLAIHFKFLELPFIDLLSLLVLTSFFISHFYFYFYSSKAPKLKLPFLGIFSAFFLATIVSAFFSDNIISSIWYSFRWIMFFYLAFIVLPFNLIKDLKILKRVLIFLSLASFLVALMGFYSLFIQDWSDSFFRLKPIYLFGDWIFGENYNLLAEFLIMSVFVVLSLKYFTQSVRLKKLINVFAFILILANLLTFGRTAWISISIQFILFFLIDFIIIKGKRPKLKELAIVSFFILIFVYPFFTKMISLQEANISSTENRFLLTKIAVESFLDKPFFGNGSGSFVFLVGDNIRFVAKYGDPLDSHGFLQKILAENGIISLIIFLIFLFLIFKRLFVAILKNKDDYKLLLPLFLSSFGVYFYQIFNTSYYKARVWIPIAVSLIAVELIYQKNKNKKDEESKHDEKN